MISSSTVKRILIEAVIFVILLASVNLGFFPYQTSEYGWLDLKIQTDADYKMAVYVTRTSELTEKLGGWSIEEPGLRKGWTSQSIVHIPAGTWFVHVKVDSRWQLLENVRFYHNQGTEVIIDAVVEGPAFVAFVVEN